MEPAERSGRGGVRRWIWIPAALAALLALGGGLALEHGLRYPPLQLDPWPRPQHAASELGWRVEAQGAYFRERAQGIVSFRAFAPEPVLTVQGTRGGPVRLLVENVHPEAAVRLEGRHPEEPFVERRMNLQRGVELEIPLGAVVTVKFEFPSRERYRFVAFGDAGGGPELRHCFRRAGELGADFILHLGDIGYREDDMENAVAAFLEAPVPVYAAIGNHDFHGGERNRHRFFSEHFGPLNSWFTAGGVDFLNLDTAADTVPATGGQRGDLLAALGTAAPEPRGRDGRPAPLVVFTHRPLNDPRVLAGARRNLHALNRAAEADWLRERLIELGAVALLAGHIHESHDFGDRGLRTIIAGEGLGRRDGARILVGEFAPFQAPEFRWEPLNMPAELRGRDIGGQDEER